MQGRVKLVFTAVEAPADAAEFEREIAAGCQVGSFRSRLDFFSSFLQEMLKTLHARLDGPLTARVGELVSVAAEDGLRVETHLSLGHAALWRLLEAVGRLVVAHWTAAAGERFRTAVLLQDRSFFDVGRL